MSIKKNTTWLINESKIIFNDLFDYTNSIYINAKTKIEFKCTKHNYIFFQLSNNHLYSKFPCKYCNIEYKRKIYADTLDDFKSKILLKYGEVYSFEFASYTNQNTEIILFCKTHKKKVINTPYMFLKGHGCSICTKDKMQGARSEKTLNEIKIFVQKLNGKCKSLNYTNNETNLEFECENGHHFLESWSDIKNSLRWCPYCSKNKLIGETISRLILEHLLGVNFPSVYLKTMEGLQLDGYNADLKIAFEYQGHQHYSNKSHFHESNFGFESQKKRDNRKKELCIENGITLIEIFEFKTIRANRIPLFLNQVINILEELKINYNKLPFKLDLIQLYKGKESELYNKAKKIVEDKNGKIQEYIGSESKHFYHCNNGHKVTNRTLGVIINTNASCPNCNNLDKFNSLIEIVKSKGGKVLDSKLKPNGFSETYDWICNKGHLRSSKGQDLVNGYWCKDCQTENKTIKFTKETLLQFIKDVESGDFYQKDLPIKYKISDGVYRRIINENKLSPIYILQDRSIQKNKTKGNLLQLDPISLEIVNKFESLESVKKVKGEKFTPEGIRIQMKNNKKAYGFYWCREIDYENTVNLLKINKS